MATQVAATTRQPFAPLNGSRLSNLTSLKNRQNAITTLTSPTKRKAQIYESDNTNNDVSENSENIDPVSFLSPSKRSKCPDGSASSTSMCKPAISNFFLTRATPSPNNFSSSLKLSTPATSPRRPMLSARSPARLDTSISKGSASAPAGRSPTRKRIGILNRRRTGRVDPPAFARSAASGLGFSIDAALSGTIPSYTPKPLTRAVNTTIQDGMSQIPTLYTGGEAKASWFFQIHEDTEEEFATNMMEHGACTLDISSDEESERREMDNRGKENVPPMDDVSQTRTVLSSSLSSSSIVETEMAREELSMQAAKASARKRRAVKVEEGEIECDRAPLGDLAAEDFYAEGCDGNSVFVIPSEEAGDHKEVHQKEVDAPEPQAQEPVQIETEERVEIDIDALMQKSEMDGVSAPKAALLQPLEGLEEGKDFELWESGSAKGDE